jgi:hypothetical protein
MKLHEIQALIGVAQEGPTLEFKGAGELNKSNPYRVRELVKDISGFANAAGGRVIYGLTESRRGGVVIAGKVDPVMDTKMTGDWITQVIKSRTMPQLTCFKCEEIAVPTGGRLIVVTIEQSSTAHQSLEDKRYWGRGAATTEMMLDHQIRDVMHRRNAPVINVLLGRTIKQLAADEHLYEIMPSLENIGTRTLERWAFGLAVPNDALDPAAKGSDLGYSKKREGLRGIEYLWLSASHRPARTAFTFDVHPGQTLTLHREMNCLPIPLRVTSNVLRTVSGHPILWRIYSPDAQPIEGEIPFDRWCDF